MKFLFLLIFTSLSFSSLLLGQGIRGTLTDDENYPLPYVSIYIKNTTIGTTSNSEGKYELSLTPGTYLVNFQFIGYKAISRSVIIEDEFQTIDIQMKAESTLLKEVVIAADQEDPAYAIIRKAIAKRKYFKDLIQEYSCDVYVKGNQKMLDAPEKIMGVEVGDLDGMLDSSRQGIVYLSESVSRLFVSGNNDKEIITSSKLSGNDRGYSFNSAREMDFSFYEDNIELQRQMISPIAGNAMSYYRYKLLGLIQDDEGRLINKIQVIPKRDSDPAFYGTIYILDELWNIHSLELGATSSATQIYFIDSLVFSQVFIPLELPDKWVRFSNTIQFKLNAFGFKLAGQFTGVYSNYDLYPAFSDNFFDANVYVVEEESNERDSIYWAEIRPVPLTSEEVQDYEIKDSIFKVRNDPVYMDSVDRRGNRFNFGDVLGGYSYSKRSKHFYYDISSPLNSFQFNTVQGFNFNFDFDARKYFDEDETRRILFGGSLNYGFSEKKFRGNAFITYRPSRLRSDQFTVRGGSSIDQFNGGNPISPFLNSVYSLFYKRNYGKFLGLRELEISFLTEPLNGVFLNTSLGWEERIPLENTTDFSFFRKEEDLYTSNDPQNPFSDGLSFDRHSAALLNATFIINFNQKYVLYPGRRFFAGNTGPQIRVSYTGAFKIGNTDISYQKLALLLQDEWSLGVGGRLGWYLNGGYFFAKDRIEFRDYRHFMGSEVFLLNNSDYSRQFLLLPYYDFSTSSGYLQAHAQHYFDGFILDKIPGIRKLGLSLVMGAKYLKSGTLPGYSEFHLGINGLGYKFFRLVRLDTVVSLSEGQSNWGVRMSIGFN